MIQCLLTEFDGAERKNSWLSGVNYTPSAAKCFPVRPSRSVIVAELKRPLFLLKHPFKGYICEHAGVGNNFAYHQSSGNLLLQRPFYVRTALLPKITYQMPMTISLILTFLQKTEKTFGG